MVDTREAAAGDLFAGVRGERVDGGRLAPDRAVIRLICLAFTTGITPAAMGTVIPFCSAR